MIDRRLGWLLAPAAALALGCGESADEGAEPGNAGSEVAEMADSAPAAPTELDVESVAARIEGGEDIFLLDVRTPEELRDDGVIAGYTHIPIDELEGRLAEVPRDKPIVAY